MIGMVFGKAFDYAPCLQALVFGKYHRPITVLLQNLKDKIPVDINLHDPFSPFFFICFVFGPRIKYI